MAAGRGEVDEPQTAVEITRGGFLSGISLRQIVVIAVIIYAAVTVLFVGKDTRAPKTIVVTNNPGLVNIGNLKSNALAQEGLSQEIPGSVSNEDANFSALRISSIDHNHGAKDQLDNDLYYDLRNSLYHSPVVFQMNYAEMQSKFKIFVYPGHEHSFKVLSGSTQSEELRYTDDLFVHHLYQSNFVTLDPELADLLFLPISIRSLVDDVRIGPQRIGKFLRDYIQSIREDYPYWSRALGADHVVVSCHDAKEDGSRNVLELKKNAIQVTCSPLAEGGLQAFYPHKDVAMPLYQDVPLPTTGIGEGERSTLAYYYGSTDASSLYASLFVSWGRDPTFVSESRDVEPAIHYKRLATSKFCLILGPQDYANIVNSLRFGCVPVLVSDGRLYDLPFQDILNWNQFTVVVSPKKLTKVKSLLLAFTEQQYITMQYLGKEASKHLEWHTPPQDQDAFYMVLYDLWVRRHVIRYIRREEL